MAETVTVGESQGPRYTWANASFTWASASAGKSWLTAYPAVYVVAVAATLAWTHTSGRQHGKRLTEALSLAETRRHQVALQKTESIGFADTYYDLIAYVLRWVESLGVAEGFSKSSRKSVNENLQTLDGLARSVAKALHESLPVSEGLLWQMRQKHAESLPVASVSARMATKAVAERADLTDGLDQGFRKQVSEALNFAETYYDLIAFILRISEGLAVSDQTARRLQKPVAEALSTNDQLTRRSVKQVAEALAFAETLGRTVAYRRHLQEGLGVSDALRWAMCLKAHEALALAEQYRRHANGVISDMIVASTEITEADFASIVEAGHPPGYTDFRDFIQGDYTYQRALFRAILKSRNSDRGFIDALRVTVDVPDVFDRGTVQITDAQAGAVIGFARIFRVPPEVTMTHKGGTVVAIPRLSSAVTRTGFTAVLENTSGTRVTGTFTWIAQGY
ncbi:hypothetical protein [Limnohabitans lacus]|uniref:Uncharacterized protein n=1 Tax=Limnohabitans lacus TaxID=3045173 RepID=A0ABT6X9B7_9BURK|nr:hypothetical protein [Limnohabitans sp. HM2-2]MDI9234731.1 hypothetical protein [Limnohabitans sp. HM2-2]